MTGSISCCSNQKQLGACEGMLPLRHPNATSSTSSSCPSKKRHPTTPWRSHSDTNPCKYPTMGGLILNVRFVWFLQEGQKKIEASHTSSPETAKSKTIHAISPRLGEPPASERKEVSSVAFEGGEGIDHPRYHKERGESRPGAFASIPDLLVLSSFLPFCGPCPKPSPKWACFFRT